MQSDCQEPVTIGTTEFTNVDELVQKVSKAAGKTIHINHVDGPVGVQARILNKDRMHALGWKAKYSFQEGIAITYSWVEKQVKNSGK